jgi:hypothetical protein
MPTSSLVNTDAYVVLRYCSRILRTSCFHDLNPVRSFAGQSLPHFHAIASSGGTLLRILASRDKLFDPNHLESH